MIRILIVTLLVASMSVVADDNVAQAGDCFEICVPHIKVGSERIEVDFLNPIQCEDWVCPNNTKYERLEESGCAISGLPTEEGGSKCIKGQIRAKKYKTVCGTSEDDPCVYKFVEEVEMDAPVCAPC